MGVARRDFAVVEFLCILPISMSVFQLQHCSLDLQDAIMEEIWERRQGTGITSYKLYYLYLYYFLQTACKSTIISKQKVYCKQCASNNKKGWKQYSMWAPGPPNHHQVWRFAGRSHELSIVVLRAKVYGSQQWGCTLTSERSRQRWALECGPEQHYKPKLTKLTNYSHSS